MADQETATIRTKSAIANEEQRLLITFCIPGDKYPRVTTGCGIGHSSLKHRSKTTYYPVRRLLRAGRKSGLKSSKAAGQPVKRWNATPYLLTDRVLGAPDHRRNRAV